MNSAAAVLAELHQAGLTARAEGGEVILAPADRVTPAAKLLIRKHKPAILAALAQEGGLPAPVPEPAPLEPRSAPAILAELRAAGLEVSAEGEAVKLAPLDRITREVLALVRAHRESILAELAAEASLEARRALVVRQLEANPHLARAFDAQGATPAGPAPHPVSVMVATRTACGIVTGALEIPGDKWDMAAFMDYWRGLP